MPIDYAKELVAEKVKQFSAKIKEYKRTTYNETEVRVDFVNPFFKALGWDIDNEAGLPQHLREVTHEAKVLVEEDGKKKGKKPDYSFKIGTELLFYLETKKPAVDITTDNAPAFQLRRYGWSGNLKVSVLTNFTDLCIYDCTIRPIESDKLSTAVVAHYNYTEYVDKFEEIYGLLSKEAVQSGRFNEVFSNIRTSLCHEPFDFYFLQQIKQWRLTLGESIAQRNPDISTETLNIGVQRILNRIIFLRICEDRSFENYETLKAVHTYEELKQLFLAADKKYDSGLFEMLEEDRHQPSDEVLVDIFKDFYYPNSSYEFSVVDPYIIGSIYELFLEEQLQLDASGKVSVVKKPEAVDSQGAVNTPKNITDIIVEQTLSTLLNKKEYSDIKRIRIADICCGSGNFLLSAFEYLINYHIEWHLSHDKEDAVKEGIIYQISGSADYRLSFQERRTILTQNIWGVDIDPLAVEVSKFSLFLKLLEYTTNEEMSASTHGSSSKILPRLEDNIKNGNSLVNMAFAKFAPYIWDDESLLDKIRMFDWKAEFNNSRFDAIIGNPPYIRVQNMVHYSPKEYAFYKSEHSGFVTASTDLLDKYYLFIERAWSLLNPDGVLGYIVPHKFMTISSGESLREYLSSNNAVCKIIHFGAHQVFKDRSTYTCVLLLSKEKHETFEIAFINDWSKFLCEHHPNFDEYNQSLLTMAPWTFIPKEITECLDLIKSKCSSLEEMSDIFVGVQTSADKIYIIYATNEDDRYVYFTDKTGNTRKAEKGILRKSIYDAKLRRFEPISANSYIIFPYTNSNGKAQLIDHTTMKKEYPEVYAYLSAYRNELDTRNMPKRTEDTWYAYGRSQSLKRFISGEHLIWPVLSLDSNYVYDSELVVFTGGGNGPFYGIEMKKTTQESIFYIQAILNHWLMELLVKKGASIFRGGYYSHGKQFIAKLPIYRIDFSNLEESKAHDSIVAQVHIIEKLKKKQNDAKNTASKDNYRRLADATFRELTEMINTLYGVTGLKMEETSESD
ncbi:MAG: Eco57I restriction-modification methylase domain-containing protein [Ruminococcus sp.]|nr:Eco57I restriction-modification methylase domain-containing protein [Ruminococcus sp.]